MKKQLLFLCIAIAAMEMQSQSAIPNPDFELWTQNSIEMSKYLPFSSNAQFYWDNLPLNVVKTQPAYHGQYAVKLETRHQNIGYLLNTDPGDGGNPASWKNGMAYTERPTGVRGYYKYNTAVGDAGLVMFVFRKNGTAIGTYQYLLSGPVTEFTLFEHTFEPALTQDPDSMIVAYASSYDYGNGNMVIGSTLTLDSVSLKGITTQPTQLNGDFEEWETVILSTTLDHWNENTKGDEGILRSTDAKTGQYAVELKTYVGEQNNLPNVQPGYLSSGYWDNNCGCIKGGQPYTLTKDTLAFWYKYIPQSNDQAQVYLDFQKNNASLGNFLINLNASPTYQYAEIPFQLGTVPDHVIIQAISSQWQNKNQLYVGSTLLLDNMYFKSSNISTQNQNIYTGSITFWPNPVTDKLHISNVGNEVQVLDIYSVTGKKVLSVSHPTTAVDVSSLAKGIYFVKIDNAELLTSYKMVKM